MTRKKKRLALIATALSVFGLAIGLTLYSLRDSIVFFYGPTEYLAKAPAPGTRLRIGGLVEKGSFKKEGGEKVVFAVTDMKHQIEVAYTGLLPDLFREGQGAVVEGTVEPNGTFLADSVLAKHDERYMPKEVADALKKSGVWKEGEPMPAYVPEKAAAR
ncbi:periplasmic heme chaperone [Beijerinckiaceae bacterium RH AL1]|nr:cytochrome c maturation protein CcmE [Beijerinckiaceae bacterium]VVB45202.1 periplasmic heme chaperone [Beijerinckiaceae bacterium RH CH11]VVB45280.1 periplasmic heme chaperone [Beijerinckiaceae bacterium RH AL8]VVC54747.1 periplasmic heme chaperone [Beijerinckiaceae bacterium RH AL1]